MLELTQAYARGDIGEVELATDEINFHAVEAAAHDSLQTVLFRKQRLSRVVHHKTTALD